MYKLARYNGKVGVEALRERWMRWLGSMMREDRSTWAELLSSGFSGWPSQVLGDATDFVIMWYTSKEALREQYQKAIKVATIDDLQRLDILFVDYNQSKKRKK